MNITTLNTVTGKSINEKHTIADNIPAIMVIIIIVLLLILYF